MRHRFAATEFEFRHRVFVIFLIFLASYACWKFDHKLAGAALARLIIDRDASVTSPGPQWPVRAIFALGTAVITLGAIIRTWATSYLHSSVVHDASLHADELVADGPYRHVRNPLYLGTFLMAMGLGLLFPPTGWLVIVSLMFLFEYRLILREENELLASQGESYARYCANVPRLLPSLRPRLPKGHRQSQWCQAFVGELAMWLFATAMLAFTITLQPKLAIIFIIAAGASQPILQYLFPAAQPANTTPQPTTPAP